MKLLALLLCAISFSHGDEAECVWDDDKGCFEYCHKMFEPIYKDQASVMSHCLDYCVKRCPPDNNRRRLQDESDANGARGQCLTSRVMDLSECCDDHESRLESVEKSFYDDFEGYWTIAGSTTNRDASCGGYGDKYQSDGNCGLTCQHAVDTAAVRCCSESEENPGGEGEPWSAPNNKCTTSFPNVKWVESDSWGRCLHTEDYNHAVAHCEDQGGRLCTIEELEANCASGTGCMHDTRRVWTSTKCKNQLEATLAMMIKTMRLQSAQLAQINQGDLSDGFWTTAGHQDYLEHEDCVSEPGGNCATLCQSSNDTTAAVRCCSKAETNPGGWRAPSLACQNAFPQVKWVASDIFEAVSGTECVDAVSVADANDICVQYGGRLCSLKEVEATCSRGTGCGHDMNRIWTSTRCSTKRPQGFWAVAGLPKNAELGCGEEEGTLAEDWNQVDGTCVPTCQKAMSSAAVRCCSEDAEDLSANGWQAPYDECTAEFPQVKWVASEATWECVHAATQADAAALCAQHGGRLCTHDEITIGCAAGTGCKHDLKRVWTSTPCEYGSD